MRNVARRVENLKRTVGEVRDRLADVGARASEMLPSKSGRGGRLRGLVRKYPLPVGVAAIVLGFVAGFALPSTQLENRRFGRFSDRTKVRLQHRAEELLEHAKDVMQRALTNSAR
jgi:hypothetical protein